jgi:NitT/TauT family transport system ATP-binding protein
VAAPRLEYRDVSKRFARAHEDVAVLAVADVSFTVRDGEVVALIGPSGCGKSTLLNIGSGLDQPSKGEVFVDGERVLRPNPHVAFMLQKDLLLPWRTIRQNVELGLEIQGVPAPERRARSERLLKSCRIADFAGHYPYQLSGGMRQRAALARTLAVDPTVLLLDEPFSALDAQTKMVLQQDLARSIKEAGKTALLITHDLVEAVALSDRVLVMSERPGRIIEELTIDLPYREDCLRRREHPALAHYVPRLMSLLHVRDATLH